MSTFSRTRGVDLSIALSAKNLPHAAVHTDAWLGWADGYDIGDPKGAVETRSLYLDSPLAALDDRSISRTEIFGIDTHGVMHRDANGHSLVTIDFGPIYSGSSAATVTIRPTDGWNTVKAVQVAGLDATALRIEDFVDCQVDLTHAAEERDLFLEGIKRGDVRTGAGSDWVQIDPWSNERYWDNTIHVETGDGKDVLQVGHYLEAGPARPAGAPAGLTYDPAWTTVEADLGPQADLFYGFLGVEYRVNTGAGDDTAWVYQGRGSVNLGAGNDEIILSTNADLGRLEVDGGPGQDLFILDGPYTRTGEAALPTFVFHKGETGSRPEWADVIETRPVIDDWINEIPVKVKLEGYSKDASAEFVHLAPHEDGGQRGLIEIHDGASTEYIKLSYLDVSKVDLHWT